jgi:transposase
MSSKKQVVALSAAERAELCLVARSGLSPARRVLRAKILLKADSQGENATDQEIAEALAVGVATVSRVRARFVAEGPQALERRPQPARPDKRRLDGKAEAQLTMLACSKPPDGREHWTLDLLADRMVKLRYVSKVSGDTVGRSLKKTSSSPG